MCVKSLYWINNVFLSRNRITVDFAKGFIINFIGFNFAILCCFGSIYSNNVNVRFLKKKKKKKISYTTPDLRQSSPILQSETSDIFVESLKENDQMTNSKFYSRS